MSAAGTIWINLKANTKDFVSGLNRAHQRVRRVAASMIRQFKRVSSAVLSLKGAVLALAGTYGLAKLSQSFLEASKAAEGYSVRLNTLLGSQREGNRLFSEMTAYATSVPFTYQEIMESATALSGVMKGGVDEITKWMPMIGDLAAASGLSIEQTTSQVIRMYSAGAAAADLFRERGILAMLGFEAGVKYSAEDTKRMMFDAWTDVDSKFKGITKELSKTWAGTMSMFSDQWFQFRLMVMESGPFEALKEGAQEALRWIEKMKTEGKLREWARDVAVGIIRSIKSVLEAIKWVKHAFHDAMVYWYKYKKHVYEKNLEVAKATRGIFIEDYDQSRALPSGRMNPKDEKEYLRLQANVEKFERLLRETTDSLNANVTATNAWDKALDALISRLEKLTFAKKGLGDEPFAIGLGLNELAGFSAGKTISSTTAPKLYDDAFMKSIDALGVGLMEIEDKSENIKEIWENTRDVIQNEIAGTLAKAITRDFSSIEDVFRSLTNNLANMWGAMVAEMSMKWAKLNLGGGALGSAGALGIIGAGIFAVSSIMDGIFGGDNDDAMRMQKLADQARELQDTIDSLTMEPLQYEMKKLNDTYGHQMNLARELRGNIDLVLEAREAEIKALQKSATAMHTDLKSDVKAYLTAKERADWGVGEYTIAASMLTSAFNKLDKNATTYQTNSLNILDQLFDVLKNIDALNEEQLANSERLIDAYNNSLKSIDDLTWELTNGSLAAVQSVGAFEGRYAELFQSALTGNTDAVQEFTDFIPTWLEYMKAYGGDYASIVSDVLGDLGIVRTGIEAAKSAEVLAMETLTASINANTDAMSVLSSVLSSGINDMIDTATAAIDWQTFMNTLPAMPDIGTNWYNMQPLPYGVEAFGSGFSGSYYKIDPALSSFFALLSGSLSSDNLPEGINMADINKYLSWYSSMPTGADVGIRDLSLIEEWLSNMPNLTLNGEPVVINTTIQIDGKTIATSVQEVAMENPEDFRIII